MDGRALEDGHYNLRDAVTGDDTSHDPAGDHKPSVGIEDATVEQESGEFDQGSRGCVEDFDQDEAL